jgi:hypothetical protein
VSQLSHIAFKGRPAAAAANPRYLFSLLSPFFFSFFLFLDFIIDVDISANQLKRSKSFYYYKSGNRGWFAFVSEA